MSIYMDADKLTVMSSANRGISFAADGSLTFIGATPEEADAIQKGWENALKRIMNYKPPKMEIGHFMVDSSCVQPLSVDDSHVIPIMVERNPEDDALFADMHSRKEDFSIDAVRKAFTDVPRREPTTLPPSAVMALDFHDSAAGKGLSLNEQVAILAAALPDDLPTIMCGPVEDDGAREAWEDAWRDAVMRKDTYVQSCE